MTRVTEDMRKRAEDFVWMTGRVLDQRRMEHDRDGVLHALDAYATGDGGYAYGLEPDIKGPLPQPLTVMTALRILDEIDAVSGEPVEKIVAWLGRQVTADGGLPAILATISRYPRPPWIEPPTHPAGGLLPTGRIAGLLHKHGVVAPWLDAATEFCWRAVDALETTHPYEAESTVFFLDHVPDRARATKAAARLGELVLSQGIVLLDPAHPESAQPAPGYADGEFHYAHDYAPTPQSLAAQWFTGEQLQAALDHLAAAQQPDGGWQIHYRRWADTIEFEARPGATIEALAILSAWDYPDRQNRP